VKVEELPLEEGMTVGDALEKAKANKRFRRATVDIQRTHNGITHKMPVDFSNGNHRVSHSTNYALHPRDRVLVTEDTSTIVDDLMQKVLGTSPKRSRRT
jgi:protein involved in polysaccharide export with SLBB domain